MVKTATNDGTVAKSSIDDVIVSCHDADVVLIGECHDDNTAHNFEKEFLKQCFGAHQGRGVILSLEMFETDVQEVVNEYLAGAIREQDFMADSRAWQNYVSDYRPLVEFARQNSIPVVAANAPRRYVSRVGSAGRGVLELLPPAARKFLPPLPYGPASEKYGDKFRAQMQALHASSSGGDASGPAGGGGGEEGKGEKACPYIGWSAERTHHMLDAQVLWDATMAHRIVQARSGETGAGAGAGAGAAGKATGGRGTSEGPLVVHVCGKFHCEQRLGIPEHLAAYDDSVRSLVVVCVGWDELSSMDERQVASLGDYVVVSPQDQAKSYQSEHPV